MRQKFIAANWKMHTTAAEARQLAKAIVDGMDTEDGSVSVAICPPFPYLALVGEILKGSRIALGAQNLYPEREGAFTGEVSPTMLLDLGCKYVILGHSERRHMGESDTFINHKVRVALAAGLDVILCVGEMLDQRKAAQTNAVLDRQLIQGLAGVSAETLPRLTLAYEPVWAIGRPGHGATPQQAQETHGVIRRRFAQMFDEKSAHSLVIQYGGSVKPENAAALLSRQGVDGALIGGASLHADQFLVIVRSCIGEAQNREGIRMKAITNRILKLGTSNECARAGIPHFTKLAA